MSTGLKAFGIIVALLAGIFVVIHRTGSDWVGIAGDTVSPRSLGHFGFRSGLGVETRYVGWGTGIVDLDNDGFPDLFVATGSVYPEVERKVPACPFHTPRLVFRNLGDGRFEELLEEAGSGVSAAHVSRGCAFGDFDNDGDMDVLIMNMNEPPSLLRNDVSGGNHWLKVLLVGVKTNRSAIGAHVTASYGSRRQVQDVLAQSSFYSANDRRLHFGLGVETTVDLTIRWTTGATETIAKVAADQLVTIREGAGIVAKQNFREVKLPATAIKEQQ